MQQTELKPLQKVELLTKYIMPGFYHLLIADPPSDTGLIKLDREIRTIIKDAFHLPHSTTNQLLYSRRRDGGLRIPRLIILVTAANLKG